MTLQEMLALVTKGHNQNAMNALAGTIHATITAIAEVTDEIVAAREDALREIMLNRREMRVEMTDRFTVIEREIVRLDRTISAVRGLATGAPLLENIQECGADPGAALSRQECPGENE